MSKHDLKIDWATHAAAKYACENWHYSDRLPIGKMVKIGAWEAGQFIGVVLFARGGSPQLGARYGVTQDQVCELVRVALTNHRAPVSRIVALALKFLKKANPKMRLIVSFADIAQGHHGGIYQAGNWVYTGCSPSAKEWWHDNKWKHNREITSGAFGGKHKVRNYTELPYRIVLGKHRYLMPLDPEMRERVLPLSKPYPKRVNASEDEESSRPPSMRKKGGASPTLTLQPDPEV